MVGFALLNPPYGSLLACLAVCEAWVSWFEHADGACYVDRGGHDDWRGAGRGRRAIRRHRIQFAALARRLLRRRCRQRPQVIRRLQPTLPRELVRIVELLSRR